MLGDGNNIPLLYIKHLASRHHDFGCVFKELTDFRWLLLYGLNCNLVYASLTSHKNHGLKLCGLRHQPIKLLAMAV